MKIFFGITTALFILSLLLLGLYNFAFKNNTAIPTVSEKGPFIKESSPLTLHSSSPKIAPVLTERILSASANTQSLYYYSLDEQAFRKATLDGKDKETLLSNLPGTPTRIVWSLAHEKALVNIKNTDNSTLWYVADLSTKTLTALKPEISRIAWDNTGSKILYQYTDPKTGDRTLNMSDSDGSNWKILVSLGTKDFFIAPIPSSVFISYWNRPNARDKGTLSKVPLTGGTPSVIASDHFGADFLWAPTGNTVLMSTTDTEDPGKSRLFVMNESGGELHSLDTVATLVSKTTWSKDGHTLYYALPNALPESTVLPNDYFEKNLHSQDSFWKIDTTNNKSERIIDLTNLTEAYDASDLFLSPQEDTLFFTDRKSQKLFHIDL